jgi:PPOX class probable F420-dependent enzyme
MAAAKLDRYLDLLTEKKAFAHLATLMPDGSPQVTPVWFDYAGGVIRVNSARGRVKDRNMKEGAAVALSILDPDNPYRYLQIRGRVKRVTENGAAAHIDALAKKYLNKDKYPFGQPGDVRVTYEIEPGRVQGMG